MDSAETKPPSNPGVSGKLVIIGIVTIAFCAAAISWYFRYNATHRAAKFWGPEMATLIRDAPKVTLFQKPTGELIASALRDPQHASFDKSARDISHAAGLVHLRNALLEDHSFAWPAIGEPSPSQASRISHWLLSFHDFNSRQTALIMFTEDCRLATQQTKSVMAYELNSISTEPMAKGLHEMFTEFSNEAAKPPAEEPLAPAR